MSTQSWSNEDIEKVRLFVSEGKTAREIAMSFAGKTRNSIIGVMHRNSIKSMTVRVKKEKTPREPRKLRREYFGLSPVKKKNEMFEFEKTWPVEHKATGTKKIDELSMFHCRAVIGDVCGVDTQYCGEVTIFGQSWCKEHYMKYFKPRDELNAKAHQGSK